MQPIYRDLFALIRAALHDEAPVLSCVEEFEWMELLNESKRHLLAAVAYVGLQKSATRPSGEVAEQWRVAKEKAVYQTVLMEKERELVFGLLREKQIAFMPLKGYWMRDLYPQFWMRQMVDTDLLVDRDKRETVRDLMLEAGYTASRYGAGHHDVYVKKPACCFEIHSSLFDESESPKYYTFFKDLHLQEEPLQPDLFYLYFIAHLYHHHQQCGVGLRSLVDCYLYLRKEGRAMDRSALLQNLKHLDLEVFERQVRCIAFKLFDRDAQPLNEQEEAFLEDFCRSGATGTLDMMVKRNVQRLKEQDKPSKWEYYKSRIFLPYEWFEDHIPFYARHRWLIPFYYVFRFFRAVLFRRKKIKAEMEALKKESL